MATSSRMLTLLSLLQARRDWPAAALADRLEISERTVRRDVDRLRELGYRIRAIKGPDGGYRLDAGSELPPLLFDDDQAVAIAVALQTASLAGAEFAEAGIRALTTVRQVMPSRLRQRIDALQVTAIRDAATPPPLDPAVLLTLAAAIRSRESLRFDYSDAPRRAEPHHLVTRAGRWYLVAFDTERDDWRTFRVDRITPRIPNGPRFEPREVPGGDVHAFVAARFKGSELEDDWPCRGSVTLAAPLAEIGPYIGEGTAEAIDDGHTRVSLGSWSWTGLAASISRFDADVSDVHPPQLAEAFETLARRFGAIT